MDQTVQDCISNSAVAEIIVPVFYRQLTGNNCASGADAVLDDFQEFLCIPGIHRGDAKVIEDQDAHFSQSFQKGEIRAVGAYQFYLGQKLGDTGIIGAIATDNGIMSKRAGDVGFSCSRSTFNDDVMLLFDPLIFRQGCDLAALQITVGEVFNILEESVSIF